jgi:Lar family restriction alleviation protein
MSDDNKLKKCPFCGGVADIEDVFINVKYEGLVTFYKIQCVTCKSQTSIFRDASGAINTWNMRHKEVN